MFEPQRLHPAAMLEYLLKKGRTLLEILVPLVILWYGQKELREWMIPGLIAVLILFCLYVFIYWSRFVFFVANHELRVEYGVLVRKKRYVPFNRIQGIQLTAGIVQRWFGLVKMEVETAAGANEVEISLVALSREQAQTLAKLLQVDSGEEKSASGPADLSVPPLQKRLSTLELLGAASTSNGIGVVLALIIALLSQIDQFFPGLDVYETIGQYFLQALGWSGWAIVLTVLTALGAAWFLSALAAMVTMSGFTLQRNGERLLISHGLLEQKQISIPVKRIQALSVVEDVLRQPFHLGHATLTTAGYAGKDMTANLLFPLLHRSQFLMVLQSFLPELATEGLQVNRLPSAALSRYLIWTLSPFLLAAVPLVIFVPGGVWLVLPLMVLGLILGYARYRAAGYRIYGDKLVIRSRFLGLSTTIIPRMRIQSLDFSQSWWQARHALGTLTVSTASGMGGASYAVSGISSRDAGLVIKWFRDQRPGKDTSAG